MLIYMPGINERKNELAGLTPAEFALIKASLDEARATAEGLLRRADALTANVASRYSRSPQAYPDAHREAGERHGSS